MDEKPSAELWERPVSYAAVGATAAPDLMQYPPSGYRPMERRARIGHGDERFDWAWSETLTWGIQKHAGFEVRIIEAPTELLEGSYAPVRFDEEGTPVSRDELDPQERVYSPDGVAYLRAGDTAVLGLPLGIKAPARVVYVVDEPNRKGFAYGTLKGHPEDGEESFIIERRDDGSVWIEIRNFSRPATWYWRLAYPVLRAFQEYFTRRYLAALAGPIPSSTD